MIAIWIITNIIIAAISIVIFYLNFSHKKIIAKINKSNARYNLSCQKYTEKCSNTIEEYSGIMDKMFELINAYEEGHNRQAKSIADLEKNNMILHYIIGEIIEYLDDNELIPAEKAEELYKKLGEALDIKTSS